MPRKAPITSATPAPMASASQKLICRSAVPEPDRIGAEAEEGGLRQIDLAAQAEHDGQAEHGDRKGRGLHEDVHRVVVHRQQADDGDDQRRQRNVSDRASEHRAVAGHAHAFSATRSPKMPCGRKIRKATSTRKAKPSLYGTET